MIEMNKRIEKNIEKLCGVLVRNKEESAKQTSKVIKTAKVSAWSKEMSHVTFGKQIEK